MGKVALGELEQWVLLGILDEGSQAFALEVRQKIELHIGRKVSRGAFYTTLERLERKGFLVWEQSQPQYARRMGTLRRFSVTARGMEALRNTQAELHRRWANLKQALEER